MFWVVARSLLGGLLGCSGWLLGPFHGPSYHHRKSWGNFGTAPAPQGATLPHFEVWSYRACQPSSNVANFHISGEIHSLSYEASSFSHVSLCVFFAAISPLG